MHYHVSTAAKKPTEEKYFRWQVGGDTDIGGSKENQDDYFVFERKDKGIIVLCILDGHGRDVGKAAAETGRDALHGFFSEHCDRVRKLSFHASLFPGPCGATMTMILWYRFTPTIPP